MSFGMSPFSTVPFAVLPLPAGRAIVAVKARAFRKETSAHARVRISARANWDFRVFAATDDYITAPQDALSSRQFLGTLNQPLRFERSILGSRIGDLQTGIGELVLDNTEGTYDALIRGYAIDGRRVVVRLGDGNRPYDTFGVVFDGTATGWHVEEDVLRVTLRDFSFRLEVAVSPNTYSGEGELGGTADLKGKRKPRLFGKCLNVRPPLVWPQKLIYQVNDGPVEATDAVYSRGNSVPFDQDYASPDELAEADVPAGAFATCNAAALFRVNFVLDGEITADVRGDKTGGAYADTTAGLIRRLLTVAGVADANIKEDSFENVDAVQPATVGIWFDTDDETFVSGAVDALIAGVGGWAGFRRDGRFEVAIFDLPSGAPQATYTDVEIIEITRLEMPRDLWPPPWRYRVAYARNWTVQTNDIAGAVSDERRAFLAEEWRLGEASNEAIKSDHLLAQDPVPIGSYFSEEEDAEAEGERQLAIFGKQRHLYQMTLKTQPFAREIGDVFSVFYDRWDLVNGKLLRIVSLREDGENNTVEIVGFG